MQMDRDKEVWGATHVGCMRESGLKLSSLQGIFKRENGACTTRHDPFPASPLPFQKRKTLHPLKKIAAFLGHPERGYPTIHIAGTNGKGSVAFKIAEALRLGGYRVGLYTSPHLFSYRERIAINGKRIAQSEVERGLERLLPLFETPHFFEVMTFLAFCYFAEQGVDIAVIETGLGGRLDPTNILRPLLTVITTIGVDHTEVLGESIEQIACEKGGIIKSRTPLVLGRDAMLEKIRNIAEKKQAPVYPVNAGGNRAIAMRALELIYPSFSLKPDALREGVSRRPPFRFQRVGPRLILDVAHNASGFFYLFHKLSRFFPGRAVSLLLSLSRGKPLAPLIPLFKEFVHEIFLFVSSLNTLQDPEAMGKSLSNGGFERWFVCNSVQHALTRLYTQEGDVLLIAGSFYMMEEVVPSLASMRSKS